MRGKIIEKPEIGKWYIVSTDHRDRNGNFNLINKEFNTKKEAQKIVDLLLKDVRYYVEVVSGQEALDSGFTFRKSRWKKTFYQNLVKYIYPKKITEMSAQEKKSFRTKQRREYRRKNKNNKS